MPYRIDVTNPPDDTLERLITLGALDAEATDNGIAALMPDTVPSARIARALGGARIRASRAVGRDEDSVWVLTPRATTIAGITFIPASAAAPPGAVRLIDSPAFGTGLHPTTALCIEAIREAVDVLHPERMLDVGTGSGVLALAALTMHVPHVVGLDIERSAIAAAAENAGINGLTPRLRLILGSVESIRGQWPLVVANVLAAPLIEMAPALVQRVAHGGRLVLSGIPSGVAHDVERAYQRLGMRRAIPYARAGWTALAFDPTW